MVEVEVEFDYDAELADELTIRSGEIIAEVKQMDGGWWEGSLRGRRGLFPDNFVQILNKDGVKASRKPSLSLSSSVDDELDEDDLEDVQLRPKNPPNSKSAHKRQCRVLFSYSPAHEDELELKLDEMVDFLGEVEDGWWKGQLNGKTGVFPSNFVEMASKTSATMEEEAEKNVEKKNQKNDSKLRGAEEPKVVEMGRTKITNLIQEAESKVKPGQLPISAFELKHNQKEQASVASLDPPPVSAVNTVVIQNHNLFVKNSKGVAPMPNNPERQRRQSPLGRESKNKSDLKASSERQPTMSGLAAPKLPPKPVKEQCVVQFPYTALNEDELTLGEGQIITIITKDVEDKGWWKGEVDGRVGVFPDNFVKLLPTSEMNTRTGSTEELEAKVPTTKKPSRPPGSTTLKDQKVKKALGGSKVSERTLSSTSSSAEDNSRGSREKLDQLDSVVGTPKKTSSSSVKEKSKKLLNASKENLNSAVDRVKNAPIVSKANPPPRPLPPSANAKPTSSPTASPSKTSTSTFIKMTTAVASKIGSGGKTQSASALADKDRSLPAIVTQDKDPSLSLTSAGATDLDCVERNERLAHPTAGRAKAPKRRPPSSVFVKEAKSNDDVFQTIVPETPDSSLADDFSESSSGTKEALSKSLDSGLSVDCRDPSPTSQLTLPDTNRETNKSRLSFKMVRKQVKDVLGGLTNGVHQSSESLHKQRANEDIAQVSFPQEPPPAKATSAKKQPPPKPPVSTAVLTTAHPENKADSRIIAPKIEEPEKPKWLEELSRKQANRRSGFFPQAHNDLSSSKAKENEAPTNHTVSPVIPESKPVIPTKPSQIRDEARKSVLLSSVKRAPSLEPAVVNPTPEPPRTSLPEEVQLRTSSSSTTTTYSSTSEPTTTSSSSTTSSVTSSPEKKSSLRKASLQKKEAFVKADAVETEPKRVVVDKKARIAAEVKAPSVDTDIHPSDPVPKADEIKCDQKSDDLEKLDQVDRIRRLEQLMDAMETKHKSEISTLMSELQTERESRNHLEAEVARLRNKS